MITMGSLEEKSSVLVCWEAVSLSPQKGVGATVWATVCWAAASGWVRAAVDTRKRHNLHGANAFIHQDTPGGARTCHEVRSVAAAMLRSVPLRRRPPDVGLEIRGVDLHCQGPTCTCTGPGLGIWGSGSSLPIQKDLLGLVRTSVNPLSVT